jgi:hypothetical protein
MARIKHRLVFLVVSPHPPITVGCQRCSTNQRSGTLLKYLACYTHRVAIANGRLLSLTQGQLRFRWRDSKHNNRIKVMRLDAVEFLRRFLLHVLPDGFVKIRHFGLLANRTPSGTSSLSATSEHHSWRTDCAAHRTPVIGSQPLLPAVSLRHLAHHCSPLGFFHHRLCRRTSGDQLFVNFIMITRTRIRCLSTTDILSVSAGVSSFFIFQIREDEAERNLHCFPSSTTSLVVRIFPVHTTVGHCRIHRNSIQSP